MPLDEPCDPIVLDLFDTGDQLRALDPPIREILRDRAQSGIFVAMIALMSLTRSDPFTARAPKRISNRAFKRHVGEPPATWRSGARARTLFPQCCGDDCQLHQEARTHACPFGWNMCMPLRETPSGRSDAECARDVRPPGSLFATKRAALEVNRPQRCARYRTAASALS